MNLPIKTLLLFAGVLWISFFTMLALGIFNSELKVLQFAAAPDGILALIVTFVAARRWTNG